MTRVKRSASPSRRRLGAASGRGAAQRPRKAPLASDSQRQRRASNGSGGSHITGSGLCPGDGPFRSLIQNTSDIVTILDRDGRICYESPAIERVLGYDTEELVGRKAFDRVHPDDRDAVRRRFVGLVERSGETAPAHFRFRHKDGSWRWLEVIGTNLLDDPEVSGIVVNSRDVTESHEASALLREREARLEEAALAADRHAQELELLDRVRTALARELDLPVLFRTVVEAIAETFGYTQVSLYLLENDELVLQHQVGYEHASDRVPTRLSITRGIMGRVVRTGTAALIEDVRTEPAFIGSLSGIISEVCVPLCDDGQIVGVLNLESSGDVVLSAADLRLMTALSEHIAIAIERARIYDRAHASEARFTAFMDNSPAAAWVKDDQARFVYVNHAFERLFATTEEEIVGKDDFAILPKRVAKEVRANDATVLREGRPLQVQERIPVPDEGWREWLTLKFPFSGPTGDRFVGGMAVDITERQQAEAQLAHLAFHDPLTDLPNRALFVDRLKQALARARRSDETIAVLFLDLDGFKLVNDSHGHDAGDRLLVSVGRRLAVSLRDGDTVARFGGDEFAILLNGVDQPSDATAAAERLIASLGSPFTIDTSEAYVNASVGIALSTRRTRPGDLLRRADIALYQAKAVGPGAAALFEPRMTAPVVARLERETDLRRALERDEFIVHYQPQVDLATGRLVGFEALARWRHPAHGVLQPADFIVPAEDSGMIVPLGRWVLQEACRTARSWPDSRDDAPDLMIGVNLSPRQFLQPSLADDVQLAVAAAGVNPERVELEITENVAMGRDAGTRRTLAALKKLGVRLAIDDFGTGYSSLSYLRDLPVDRLKIDGSFIAGRDRGSKAIVRAVSTLVQDLGLGATAEGIETVEQAQLLREIGVDRGQGYFFGRPMDDRAVTALLKKGPSLAEWERLVPAGKDS